MKKNILVTTTLKVLALTTLLFGYASQAAPIWSNTDKGGDDYLVGTVHLGDNRFQQLSEQIKAAINTTDIVVLELDLTALSPMEQQQITLKYGLLPAGKTLSTELSPKVYRQAGEYLAKLGYDIAQFAQMKPWMLGLTMVQLTYVAQGLDVNKGVDQQISAYAKQLGKPVIGLETFEQQMQFFDQILGSNKNLNSDDLILDTLNELSAHSDLPKQMLQAWLEGDMSAFETIYRQTLGQSEFDLAAEEILLTNRNKDWLQQLTPLLAQKKVVVAVGTLHYVGPNSLLKLLPSDFKQIK